MYLNASFICEEHRKRCTNACKKKKSDFNSLYASRAIMKLGSKVNWKDALYATTGYSEYRIEPLLAYYEPVREWLQREIERHKIPVGWN